MVIMHIFAYIWDIHSNHIHIEIKNDIDLYLIFQIYTVIIIAFPQRLPYDFQERISNLQGFSLPH